MFSFQQFQHIPHIPLPPQEEEEEEDDDVIMEDVQESEELIVFPPATNASVEIQMDTIRPRQRPPLMAVAHPNALLAGKPLEDLTMDHVNTVASHWALPIFVQRSPMVVLLTNKDARPVHINWVKSCYQLRELMMATLYGAIKVPRGITEKEVETARQSFYDQITLSGNSHYDRLLEASDLEQRALLCEEYSYTYLHLLERFLFAIHVEPLRTPLQLADVLTPVNPNITCPMDEEAITFMTQFFLVKQHILGLDPPVFPEEEAFKQRLRRMRPTFRGCVDESLMHDYMKMMQE